MLNADDRFRRAPLVAWILLVLSGIALVAQGRGSESSREQWQKVDEIFQAMDVRPGASVADIGAGDGFLTARLSAAVGPDGRVHAVDVSDNALDRLRQRVERDQLGNVNIIKGSTADPRLPEAALDAALIVNAYHEMREHQSMLAGIRRGLKASGRLVIVEPIADRRRDKSREEQTRNHEIAPTFIEQDAREAGFTIVSLQDPFTHRQDDTEWLMILTIQPAGQTWSFRAPLFSPRPRWR